MGVIVGMSLPPVEFQVGRILGDGEGSTISLESIVPLGTTSAPLVRVSGPVDGFRERVAANPSVRDLRVIAESNGEMVYALDWDADGDTLIEGLGRYNGTVLSANKRAQDPWALEILFETADSLKGFQEHCQEHDLGVDIDRVVEMSAGGQNPPYGVTEPQREALVAAIEAGYFAIPRETSTKELADQLGISDQAVTERLRRAMRNLGTNTVLRGPNSDRW